MTGDTVRMLLGDAAEFLRLTAPGYIVLDNTLFPGDGTTREGVLDRGGRIDIDRVFSIGVKNLEGNHNELSNYEAMKPVVAFFHEVCGHGGQLKYEFMKDAPLSKVLALNHYACKSSDAYYYGNAQVGMFSPGYARQVSEIAAQYMGLKCARTYMNEYFKGDLEKDPMFVDRMLLDYVNERQRNHSEHIERAGGMRNFDTMKQVLDEFNSRFQACVDAHHEYKPDADDPVYACRKAGAVSLFDKLFLSSCKSGTRQDIMMCAVSRYADPDAAVYFSCPAFDGVDLSIASAFSRDGPGVAVDFKLRPMEEMKNMVEASLADGNPITRTRPPDPPGPGV